MFLLLFCVCVFYGVELLSLMCLMFLVIPQGLQHLKHLQILNLYYNCIPSLEEVKVLFELPVLRDLDLRLNPLGKTDPNYRPYVVHAMASLRKLGKESAGLLIPDKF